MAPVLKKLDGRVSVKFALSLIGKTIDDLPKLDGYVTEKNQSKLCWTYLLGMCPKGKSCHFSKGHLPASALSDDFVRLALELLTPAMQKLMQEPPQKRAKKKTG